MKRYMICLAPSKNNEVILKIHSYLDAQQKTHQMVPMYDKVRNRLDLLTWTGMLDEMDVKALRKIQGVISVEEFRAEDK